MNQRHINNIEEALRFWETIPPYDVVEHLDEWECGTKACFGGWLARFHKFGLVIGPDGRPVHVVGASVHGIAHHLFGDKTLFKPRREYEEHEGTDHEVVNKRLLNALARAKKA